MCSQQHVRNNGFGYQVGPLRFNAEVDVLAYVTIRPSVKPALFDVGEIVRRKVIAKLIPLVHRGPQLTGVGIEPDAHGVTQAAGINVGVLAVRIRDRDGCPSRIRFNRNVGFRPHSYEQLFAIRAEGERTRPVLVVALSRQIPNMFRLAYSPGGFGIVAKTDHLVGVADVDVVVMEQSKVIGKDVARPGLAALLPVVQHDNLPGPRVGNETSPLGATARQRASSKSRANTETVKPWGTWGLNPGGGGTTPGGVSMEEVA